ncbi:solute carrier family 12 member 8 [Cloeon dipterum]|uniref:solute carrier family 12 member 8 n=1 Tax=Cloeon dipterum TaxID=197152 RepID=UPI0032206243
MSRGRKDVDWDRFGLENRNPRSPSDGRGSVRSSDDGDWYGAYAGHRPSDELFAQEESNQPWWKSQFFISQPVLFGTWDGVFTSCLINIFGVIVFLRSGWMVAEAGIIQAILIVIVTVSIVLISVLSAVGICERCRVESGGVYFLLSHVLGSRLGGAIGLLYCFGQAVGCALYVTGFGESMARLAGFDSPWAERGFAGAAVLALGVINVAGVKWVVKLQFLLLLILLMAGLDFAVGSFVHTDPAAGFDGWLTGNLANNTFSSYSEGSSWFTVFGVFFPTVTGVMAGINMSGDLRHPSTDIPNGTLSAIGTSTFLYLMFVFVLGATCRRDVLLTDFMIAAKVSAISVMLLAGLYVSSMSSCLAAMYGTPRVLQSIANENVIPGIAILGRGRGPNKVPLYSMAVVAVTTLSFILVGQINTLAPIVTMPFLLTYAAIDYSYFALAQTHEIQLRREDRFRAQEFLSKSRTSQGYGATEDENSPDKYEDSGDLDQLFPERLRHKKIARQMSEMSNVSVPVSTPDDPPTPNQSKPSAPVPIRSKLNNWYSGFCNRWISLVGALIKLLVMLLVHWGYALASVGLVFVVWTYVGHANPAVNPGIAAEFRLLPWLRNCLMRALGRPGQEYEQIVVPPKHPGLEVEAAQQNDENEDFANRSRYHHTSTVQGRLVTIDDDED